MSQEGDSSGNLPPDAAAGGAARGAPIHPRLLAMMMAARYFGLELDPNEFRNGPGKPCRAPLRSPIGQRIPACGRGRCGCAGAI